MRTSAFVVVVAVASALAIATVYADDKCSKITRSCPTQGHKCEGDFIINGTEVCNHNSKCCAMPLYCVSGKCREETRDRECKNDTDCRAAVYGTHIITCINNKCIVQGSFNDSCSKDEHCSGDQKCSKDKCAGLAVGKNCTNTKGFQCGANRTCYDGKCMAAVAVGEKCSEQKPCDVYSICNDGVCIDRWSLKEGDKCTANNTCGKGLYCDKYENTCKKAVKHRHIKCTDDSDCKDYGNHSTCSLCDAIDGKMYCSEPENVAPDCISELKSAYKCYRKHGCAPVPSSSLDTCTQNDCTAETNAIFACRSACDDYKMEVGKKCLSDLMLRYCPLIPTWLRIVIAFSILIVIIAVVFTIYGIYNCCCKKKNDYMVVNDQETK